MKGAGVDHPGVLGGEGAERAGRCVSWSDAREPLL
jgi:hypothetical protein